MTVIITGSTGLIGSAIKARLSIEESIVSIGRHSTSDIRLDLSSDSYGKLVMPSADLFVHAAGITDEDIQEAPGPSLLRSFNSAEYIAQQCLDQGIASLVYISTAHVYGPLAGTITESSLPNPLSTYAFCHYLTEQVFRRASGRGLNVLIVRPCAVFGAPLTLESFRRWSLIPFSFPRDAVKGGKIVIRSTGEQRRNFVGTDDIAELIQQWYRQRKSENFTIANAVGNCSSSVYEFALKCVATCKELGLGSPIVERVAPSGHVLGADLDYVTQQGYSYKKQSLEKYLKDMMMAISEQRSL